MKKLLKFLMLVILAAAGVLAYQGYDKYSSALKNAPLAEKTAEIRAQENYTPIDELPKTFVNAMVAVEDRRFFRHRGFDARGTARAIVTDIRTRSLAEGGSTITQQLAKNIYFPLDDSPARKIAEIFMALKIEIEYSKSDILELYFNVIYYGKGCYCIYDAAQEYFGKKPSELTDYESTMLAGLPNAPSVLSAAPERAAERQKKVLKSMVRAGYITESEMNKILNEG